jgi:hypothetical protein
MRFNAWGHRVYEERFCRLCSRQLLLHDGRKPISLFRPYPEVVTYPESEMFDDGRMHTTDYIYCNEEHHRTWLSWSEMSAQ